MDQRHAPAFADAGYLLLNSNDMLFKKGLRGTWQSPQTSCCNSEKQQILDDLWIKEKIPKSLKLSTQNFKSL